ncbi:MerR family transcriptional regulator [Streptomyces sp. CB01881]|uniref:MerR family transcriptional regulator n=1 Tax=Streptomyces sp. CB01881 TaxID=2078691 RepID=UPI000CDC40CE|nr:MerR family transcriptional regulator [Streptomyces sp. CB01881]AUY51480.1 MerR family transcriptional regulator [Streptomyces sp. CB01881]TYC74873.1 MerR family transcriptional regulator [Streptomyces sp. CB01881]
MEDTPETQLAIGEFARRSRLSLKALRLYDRLGLLAPARVDPDTGYRFYGAGQVEQARQIALLRRLDMPLAAVADVLAAGGPAGADLVAGYWASVERRIAVQRELAVYLRVQLSGGGERTPSMYPIERREVPEQTVLSERRHVRIGELSAWIPAACRRMEAVADGCGGVAGPPFVIYHGEVSEDGDGPVEVCVPVDPALAGHAGPAATVRVEPAHDELYTRLTRSQMDYPYLLGGYEAVHRSADERGLEVAGSAREIYFGPYVGPDPQEPICDVAVPVR